MSGRPHVISERVDAVLDRVFAIFAALVFVVTAVLLIAITLRDLFAIN